MRLVGISACLPKHIAYPSEAYGRFTPFEVDRIVGNTGVLRKREAAPGVTATDMCIKAADQLLAGLGWARDSVDALILCTTLPDYITPASSHRAQHELGIRTSCLVFDITLACSGFTHGALLFHGDAGTAIAFSSEGQQVKAVTYGADGSGLDIMMVPGGAARSPWTPALFDRTANEAGGASCGDPSTWCCAGPRCSPSRSSGCRPWWSRCSSSRGGPATTSMPTCRTKPTGS